MNLLIQIHLKKPSRSGPIEGVFSNDVKMFCESIKLLTERPELGLKYYDSISKFAVLTDLSKAPDAIILSCNLKEIQRALIEINTQLQPFKDKLFNQITTM